MLGGRIFALAGARAGALARQPLAAARPLVAARQLSGSAPLATDLVVGVTLIDSEGKRHPMKGMVGQSISQASHMNGLEDVLEMDDQENSSVTQIHHNERWTEDNWGEGCVSNNTHVILPLEWYNKVPPPNWDEVAQLENMEYFDRHERTSTSRIASQIILTKDLDGIEVHVVDQYPVDIP